MLYCANALSQNISCVFFCYFFRCVNLQFCTLMCCNFWFIANYVRPLANKELGPYLLIYF